MLTLRCTVKLLSRLHARPEPTSPQSTTLLGDRYANLLTWRSGHLVLLVNELTRLPVVLPARALGTLARRAPDAVAELLGGLGVDPARIGAERSAMDEVVFARTASRSVLGTMKEFTFQLEHMLDRFPNETPYDLSMSLADRLATVPPHGYQRPTEVAIQAFTLGAAAAGRMVKTAAPSKSGLSRVFEVSVTLLGTEPPVWRLLQVRSDTSLYGLHRLLQRAMGWADTHLHRFTIGKRTYGSPGLEAGASLEDEFTVHLGRVLPTIDARLVYEYDFGDGWTHLVVLERVLTPDFHDMYPRVISGARACPPEDCGGPSGYFDLLLTLQDPTCPNYAEVREWVGESFDPEAFDAEAVNRNLRGMYL